jgi:hypothetical protein
VFFTFVQSLSWQIIVFHSTNPKELEKSQQNRPFRTCSDGERSRKARESLALLQYMSGHCRTRLVATMAPLSDALPVVGRSAGGVGLLLFFDAVHGENRPDVRQHPVNIPRGAAQRGTTTVSHNNENMVFLRSIVSYCMFVSSLRR